MPAESSDLLPGFIVLYRWRLHPGAEDAFVSGWSYLSEQLRSRGSLGSRLHRGSDGIWYSYAQWPSAQAREDAFSMQELCGAAREQMRSAIAEQFPEIVLEPIADYLVCQSNDNQPFVPLKARQIMGFDWHRGPITRATEVNETYRNTQSVRRFLKSECGDAFKFDRSFMAWIKSGAPKNMGEVADEWIRLHNQ
jgi:hypothetical protein